MKRIKILLTCLSTCGIGLMIVLCFFGTAFAAEPINTKGDLVTQETEQGNISARQSASTNIVVCGYIIPMESTPAKVSSGSKAVPRTAGTLPKTGDSDLSKYSLVLELIILVLMLLLLFVWNRTSEDEEDERTTGICYVEKA